MTHSNEVFTHQELKHAVLALHCSLGSGRQWTRLAEALGDGYQTFAPDLSGYGTNTAHPVLPMTLAEEVALLSEHIDGSTGPIHLVGHSYGGAVAFKMATSAQYASRIRSLTLIEPILPTLLRESVADRRLHDSLRIWHATFMSISGTACIWKRSKSFCCSGMARARAKCCPAKRGCA